jgi:hypothetical protein
MQKYIFHRPGHGEASEGHYAGFRMSYMAYTKGWPFVKL